MQFFATSLTATQQVSAAHSQQAVEAVEAYLRRGAALPACPSQSLPAASFLSKLLAFVR